MRSNREWNDQRLDRAFRLDGPGPARPLERGAEAALVLAALSGAGFAVPPPLGGGGGGGTAAAPAKPGLQVVSGKAGGTAAKVGGKLPASAATTGVGKIALVVGGGAAITTAAVIAWLTLRRPHGETIATVSSTTRAATAQVAATEPAAPAPAPAEVAPAPPVESPAVVVHVDKPERPEHHASKPAIEKAPLIEKAPVVETPAPVVVKAPADLLAEANAARAAHDWKHADEIYAQVEALPNPLAAGTALVADAQLRLEHLGDAAGAAKRFRRALAASPRGALAEDARWGLAEALRALGDARGEAAALADFLAHHADSPLAARARARAAELDKAQ